MTIAIQCIRCRQPFANAAGVSSHYKIHHDYKPRFSLLEHQSGLCDCETLKRLAQDPNVDYIPTDDRDVFLIRSKAPKRHILGDID